MYIDETSRLIFKKNKEKVESLPLLDRVIGLKEVLDILKISESSLRRSIANGEFSQKKEDYKKIGGAMIFNLEAILNRKDMDYKMYWVLKEEYDRDRINEMIFGDSCNSTPDEGKINPQDIKDILDNVKQIKNILETNN